MKGRRKLQGGGRRRRETSGMHVSFRGRPEVNFAVPSDSCGLVNRRCRPKGLRSVARISEMIHGDEHPIGELPCFPSVDSNS